MSAHTDPPVSTSVSVADTDVDDGTYVPPMLLVVFGLPIFLTLIWFFLRFTAPDRFGRIDRDRLDGSDADDTIEGEDERRDPS